MKGAKVFRGQPLLLLVGVIASWSSVRAMTWHAPEAYTRLAGVQAVRPAEAALGPYSAPPVPAPYSIPVMTWAERPFEGVELADMRSGYPHAAWKVASGSAMAQPPHTHMRHGPEYPGTAARTSSSIRIPAAGNHLAMTPGLLEAPLSGTLPTYLEESAGLPTNIALAANNFVPPPLAGDADGPTSAKRLSIDSWMLMRRDSSSAPAAIGGSYGRSQAGAVVRYELIPGSPFQPRAYVRATRSIEGPQEGELAAGLSGRPLPGLPVLLAGEVRYYRTPARDEFRPSVYAMTQFQPQRLPMDFRAESYFQGGYVGGQFATPFIDGQIRIDRKLFRFGDIELRGGGGIWGGAQKGAQRLDVGPGMSVYFGNGTLNSRLSLDYRFRMAGDAAPQSGPALTLSAGF